MTPAELARRTYIALIHYPVYDKHGRTVATSITNLDIHDIARSSKTYGLASYFIVHPVLAQRELAQRVVNHWQIGNGQKQNDFRREALDMVVVTSSIEDVVATINSCHGALPLVVGTSARRMLNVVGFGAPLRDPALLGDRPLLILLGTGWGLIEQWTECKVEKFFPPIHGTADYNHLSVRTAAGIMLDRIFSQPGLDSGEHSQ